MIGANTILISLALLSGAAALGACVFLRRAQIRWRERCLTLEAQLPELRHQMELVASINARAQRQIKRMKTDAPVDALRANQTRLADPKRSLNEAIKAARQGSDSIHLSAQHGLSRAEADLIERLHGRALRV
ncbi:MAG TPA: hypothetical protein VGI93_17640 [Steroidobacteraceae bacterium]|jgi:hypothetical protein